MHARLRGSALMALQAIFFWIFSAVLILSALMVIWARNPVHSVLFLILAFFNAAGLFVLMGAEFLAMILVVVYVGAVLVLFLFVVMMLDVDFAELRAGWVKNAPLGVLVGIVLAVELISFLFYWAISAGSEARAASPMPDLATTGISNTEALGRILYTDYLLYFEVAGLILLIAMIGAIVLTLRHKVAVKRQSIARQVGRRPALAVELVKLKPGEARVPKEGVRR
jgi:NADH-quinone oxidoreductase subunit J